MTEARPSPSRLWRTMTLDQRRRASRAFWSDPDAAADQAQAALFVAQQMRFRAKTVIALDEDRKARHLASIVSLPDTIAARALIAYHLAEQRPMMGAFLDALGIKHQNGLIEQDDVKPDASKLASAASAIARQFPADEVRLYLKTLVCQDPETWGGLSAFTEGTEASDQES